VRRVAVRARALTVALVVLAAAKPAAAHPLDLGYLRVEVDGAEVRIALDVEAGLAARLVGLDRDHFDGAIVGERAEALAEASDRLAPLISSGHACAWAGATAVRRDNTVSIVDRARCDGPVRALRWSLPLVARASSRFQLLAKVRGLGAERVTVVDAAHPSLELAGDGAVATLDFVHTGIAHIGAAPSEWHDRDGWKLPDGLDHILFVLALVLCGGTLRQLAGVATGFTVGHSVTLALATLGVARPAPSLIEPLIALSIAVVAMEALWQTRGRWTIAALFGLVHGFGFAGALRDLELDAAGTARALVGFNVGVELGQLAIIAVTAPLVMLASRRRSTRALVTRVAPAAIVVCGLYWFVVRLAA